MTAILLGFFAVDTWRNAPQTFIAIVAILTVAVLLDLSTRSTGHRGTAMPRVGPAARN